MAAAVPFALKAGAMVGGSLLGKLTNKPSKAQSSAMQGTQQAAQQVDKVSGPLMQQGSALAGQGAGYLRQGAGQLGQAGGYYGNILSNRRAASESLAPEMTTALDYYKGAASKTARTQRGGGRDYALAELDRQKVGQIAGMLPAARANAAAGMTNVGSATGNLGSSAIYGGGAMTGQGVQAATSNAYINSGLFNNATTLRNQEGEGGKQWGSMLYDMAGSLYGGGKKQLPSSRPPVNPLYTGPTATSSMMR